MTTPLSKLEIKGSFLEPDQGHLQKKSTANILNGKRLLFSLSLEIRQNFTLSSLLFNIVLEVLASAIRHEDEIKSIQRKGIIKNYFCS